MTIQSLSRRSEDTEDVLAALCAAETLIREHDLHVRRVEVEPSKPGMETIIDGKVDASRPKIEVYCHDELALATWCTATGAGSVLVSRRDGDAGLQFSAAHGAFHWRGFVTVLADSPFMRRLETGAEPGQARFPTAALRAALAMPEPATT